MEWWFKDLKNEWSHSRVHTCTSITNTYTCLAATFPLFLRKGRRFETKDTYIVLYLSSITVHVITMTSGFLRTNMVLSRCMDLLEGWPRTYDQTTVMKTIIVNSVVVSNSILSFSFWLVEKIDSAHPISKPSVTQCCLYNVRWSSLFNNVSKTFYASSIITLQQCIDCPVAQPRHCMTPSSVETRVAMCEKYVNRIIIKNLSIGCCSPSDSLSSVERVWVYISIAWSSVVWRLLCLLSIER